MGRTSTKENKNSYQLAREELGLTREKASELLETIAPERIEKIENERTVPRPDEVLTMAEKYKRPALCNYYCSRQCPIGREYVPQVSVRELSAIVLEMLASLNAMDKKKERLIDAYTGCVFGFWLAVFQGRGAGIPRDVVCREGRGDAAVRHRTAAAGGACGRGRAALAAGAAGAGGRRLWHFEKYRVT